MRLSGLNILTGKSFKKAKLIADSFVSATVVLLISDFDDSSSFPHVGFIVTKKNGCAVKRNLIKRRLRVVATNIVAPFAKNMKSYIFIPRFRFLESSLSDIKKDVFYCLRKAKAIME